MSTKGNYRVASLAGSAMRLAEIEPRDDADLPAGVARGIYVTTAGTIAVVDSTGGAAVTITSTACQYHPISVRRVLATGTNATGIVALY